jgi:hypothetical protein
LNVERLPGAQVVNAGPHLIYGELGDFLRRRVLGLTHLVAGDAFGVLGAADLVPRPSDLVLGFVHPVVGNEEVVLGL